MFPFAPEVLIKRLRAMYKSGESVPTLIFEIHRHNGWSDYRRLHTIACFVATFRLSIHEGMDCSACWVVGPLDDMTRWENLTFGLTPDTRASIDLIELHRPEWDV